MSDDVVSVKVDIRPIEANYGKVYVIGNVDVDCLLKIELELIAKGRPFLIVPIYFGSGDAPDFSGVKSRNIVMPQVINGDLSFKELYCIGEMFISSNGIEGYDICVTYKK